MEKTDAKADAKAGTPMRRLQSPIVGRPGFSRSRLVLVLSFAASFIAAYFAFTFIASFWAARPGSSFSIATDHDGDEVFSDALVLKGASNAVRIADAPGLSPVADTDFIFFLWFKMREQLAKEERVYLMGKFDPESKERIGYGLALASGPDGIRPQVYWQPSSGTGKWYTFAAAPLRPQQWYLMTLSFRDHKYLGVHLVPLGPGGDPLVLGGYGVDSPNLPASPADLVVGAFGQTTFKGRIGPFGVIQSKAFSDDIPAFLRLIAAEPLTLPEAIDPKEVALWASPRKDRGPQALKILSARTGREIPSKRADE